MVSLSLKEARLWWSAAQGLDEPRDEPLHETVARTGWLRTLGGAEPYLGLSLRNSSFTVQGMHDAVAARQLRVSPGPRGCIYLIPQAHAGLALRLAHRLSATRNARDVTKAGVKTGELKAVGEAIVEVLRAGPQSTQSLRKVLPKGAVRSLGDVGKKVGITSTLPPALRVLEFDGQIFRKAAQDRLDHERYDWHLDPSPVEQVEAAEDDLTLAQLFFQWAGPATQAEFAAWSGLNQTQSKKAMARGELTPLNIEGLTETYYGSAKPSGGTKKRAVYVPAMDNIYALRKKAAPMVDAQHHEVEASNFGAGGRKRLADMSQPIERTILCQGQVVGLWAWDPMDESIVQHALQGPKVSAAEGKRVHKVISELGTGRVFSIDSEKRMGARADRLRALG